MRPALLRVPNPRLICTPVKQSATIPVSCVCVALVLCKYTERNNSCNEFLSALVIHESTFATQKEGIKCPSLR